MMRPHRDLLLTFADYAGPAQRLGRACGMEPVLIDVHVFPDGERRVQVPESLPERVVLCRTLNDPDHKLIELLLAADTLRANGAKDLTLVAPYLCYMRQDKAFAPGQAVSQRIIGGLIASRFDALVTVDPHLHRVHDLGEAVPVKRPVALRATAAMAEFLGTQADAPVIVGPDEESQQWVAAIAGQCGVDHAVARKRRKGDRHVEVELPDQPFRGLNAVLVDDVASTGRTLEAAAVELLRQGAATVDVLVTHALFVGDALERLAAAGVKRIWSTDSIPHRTNVIFLAETLAEAL